ncbi:hypothetical protein DL96DRAFT_1588586 [Flagelloscypha sp. PMI_526]|nr:hypothetical protein DL96DRAFT_1588586 [Flagelloscypha sp. PMI_526]
MKFLTALGVTLLSSAIAVLAIPENVVPFSDITTTSRYVLTTNSDDSVFLKATEDGVLTVENSSFETASTNNSLVFTFVDATYRDPKWGTTLSGKQLKSGLFPDLNVAYNRQKLVWVANYGVDATYNGFAQQPASGDASAVAIKVGGGDVYLSETATASNPEVVWFLREVPEAETTSARRSHARDFAA